MVSGFGREPFPPTKTCSSAQSGKGVPHGNPFNPDESALSADLQSLLSGASAPAAIARRYPFSSERRSGGAAGCGLMLAAPWLFKTLGWAATLRVTPKSAMILGWAFFGFSIWMAAGGFLVQTSPWLPYLVWGGSILYVIERAAKFLTTCGTSARRSSARATT